MNTDFEKDYFEFQTIMEQSEETIPTAVQSFVERFGTCRTKVLLLYSQSMECGNPYLDVIGDIHPEMAHNLVATFREYGITDFTLSSTEPFVTQTAWQLIEEGCQLKGMLLLNCISVNEEKTGRGMKPAFLFTLDTSV